MTKRLISIAAAAAMIFGAVGTASATQSRIRSMGGGIKQLTVLDETNIFFLPAEIVKYGTWAAIEMGAADVTGGKNNADAGTNNSFQIHYNFNPTSVLGVYGSTNDVNSIRLGQRLGMGGVDWTQDAALAAGPGLPPEANQTDVDGGHKGTIFYGHDLGNARIGFMLGAFSDGLATFDSDNNITANNGALVIDFGFGAGFAAGPGDIDLGLLVSMAFPTNEDSEGALVEANQFDIGLVFRGAFPFSGPHEIVPFAVMDLGFGSGQNLAADPSPTFSGFLFNFTAGVDIRLNLGDGITVQPGIGFSGGIVNRAQDNDGIISNRSAHQFTFPFYNLAVDVKVTDWLDIRFGGAQRVYWVWNNGDDDGAQIATSTESRVDSSISTGLGFNLPAGVSLDVEVSTGWWQRGPYLLSGDGGGFGVNAALSKDW